jgi:hypothetical protein
MVEVAALPGFTLAVAGLSDMLKSGGAAVTVTVTADDFEAAKVVSPEYAAVIEWVPAARLVVA